MFFHICFINIFYWRLKIKIYLVKNNINKDTRAYRLYLQILQLAIGPIFAELFHVFSVHCLQVAEQNVFQLTIPLFIQYSKLTFVDQGYVNTTVHGEQLQNKLSIQY